MIAFSYYGAKNRMLPQLLPLLPKCDHYCEPYAGSATVLLNREKSPIETLNDLNGDIVNFFKVLRDNPDQLVHKLQLTPYSFAEFMQSWEMSDCNIENARRFFIRIQMDISKGGNKTNKSWSSVVTYKKGSSPSAVKNFFSKVDNLMDIAKRLRMVQIENRPALKVIEKYDTPKTLFYLDPPYLHNSRSSKNDYQFEMDTEAHIKLSEQLNSIKGMAALSGYYDPIMDQLYPAEKWKKITFKPKKVPMSGSSGLIREECLWVNYPISIQSKLFQ